MSLPAQNVAPQIVAAAGQTVFPFSWRCDDSLLVRVYVNDTLDGGFTVIRNADQTASPGGTITRAFACAGGEVVTVERLSPLAQTAAFIKYGPFPADSITTMVDKFVMLSQEASSILGKCVQVARSQLYKFASLEIPVAAAGSALGFVADPLDASKVRFGLIDVIAYVNQQLSGFPAIQPLRWGLVQTVEGTLNFNIAGALVSSPDVYLVTVDGVPQDPAAYVISLSGTPQIQFFEAPPLNAIIIVRSMSYAKAASVGDVMLVLATGATVSRMEADRARDWMTVKDFNAKGDDVADDTAAIQKAVNTHPRIFVPPGIYKISAAISLPRGHKLLGVKSNVSGEGSWLHQTTANHHLTLVGTSPSYHQYSEVAGLTFTGAPGLGIRTAYTESFDIHDCIFSGTVYGLYMSTNASEQDVKAHIYRNIFSCSNTGIWTGDTRMADAWINENTFIDCASYAMRIGYLDGGFVTQNAVFSTLSSGTENNGFLIHKPSWARISDNQFFQVNGIALHVTTPVWTHIERNVAVQTGQTARKTAFNFVQYASLTSSNVFLKENVAKEVYGPAFTVSLPATDWEISSNTVQTAGYTSSSLVNDGFILNNITRLKMFRNTVDGAAKTRYWANFQNITGAIIDRNTNQNCVNPGPFLNTGITGLDYKSTALSTGNATRFIAVNEGIITSDATAGAVNLTLPSAVVVGAGKRYTVTKIDASGNAVGVVGNAQTINGAASFSLTAQYKRVVVYSDGANWLIESNN